MTLQQTGFAITFEPAVRMACSETFERFRVWHDPELPHLPRCKRCERAAAGS